MGTPIRVSITFCVCLFLLGIPPAVAQSPASPAPPGAQSESSRPWYLGLTVVATSRPEGEQDYHYTSPMLGGTTPELVATVGVHLNSRVSVGGELSFGRALSDVLVFNHFLYFSDRVAYREPFLSAFVRLHVPIGRVTIEPLAAIGLALATARYTDHWDSRPQQSVADSSEHATYAGWGPGVEVVVPIGRQLSVTASGRWYYIGRKHGDTFSIGGIGNWSYLFGAGLRFTSR